MAILDVFLAASPLILVLVLMVGFRWNGARAGAAGWITAIGVAALRFGAGGELLLWAQVRGFFLAAYVLYIIWGALFFFRVTEANGSLDAMGDLLQQLSPGRALQALLLAWAFASFLQGAGGFGVPVAVVAPLLVSLGFPPLHAVAMPSLGHAWAISFGSLGSSFYALMVSTGLEGAAIAPWMAIVLSLVCFYVGAAVLWIAGGRTALREAWLPMATMALAMSLVQLGAALIGLWSIAAMLGSIAGLAVGSVWALIRQRGAPATAHAGARPAVAPVSATFPYLLLLLIIFGEKFIPPLNALLNLVVLEIRIPEVRTALGWTVVSDTTRAISIFGHPGALLVYTAIITLLVSHRQGNLPPGSGEKIRKGVVRSGLKSTAGILAMVAMATTMDNAGMVAELSTAMANLAGPLFPLVSPFIGALGAFMTGSNTNSNVLFGAFQREVAEQLGYTVPLILAIHNAGAAVGSVFAPAKVIVGCSTVGLSGDEGEVLRYLTRYCLIAIGLVALLGLILT